MKKFIKVSAVIVLLAFLTHYLIYQRGWFIDLHPEREVQTRFRASGSQLQILSGGQFEPFVVKGVVLESAKPGAFSTDFTVSREEYLRWFRQIQEMGANTVRIQTILNDTFYNAFYEYNTKNEQPLYLIQELWVTDYANDAYFDAYDSQFGDKLLEDGYSAVDIVHGRKNQPTGKVQGSGTYRKDISRWVLGYVLGVSWEERTIAYTDHKNAGMSPYEGEYYQAGEEATPFENLMARIMDQMTAYESKKYKEQRLISFASSPETDPFEYIYDIQSQLEKYVKLDIEHIRATERVISGCFASYRMFDYLPDFSEYLAPEEKLRLEHCLKDLDTDAAYSGYLELLGRYHTVPVLINGYGFSSSRGSEKISSVSGTRKANLTEKEQGEALVRVYRDVRKAGLCGAVISSWQDVWAQRGFNTMYAVDVTQLPYWHDVQTADTGYGLLAFEAGKEAVCSVDGDNSEWENLQPAAQNGEYRVYVQYDCQYLYLFVENVRIPEEHTIYIPFDLTPRTGSRVMKGKNLEFDREADFVLCLKDKHNSRLMVQRRYEVLRAGYLKDTQFLDPYVEVPDADTPVFRRIYLLLRSEKTGLYEYENGERVKKAAEVFETGLFTYGDANPQHEDYHSLADFCSGEQGTEIRIPWQLLNFYNPSKMQIHDDYYSHYGVEPLKIRTLYLGIAAEGQDEPIGLFPVELKGWSGRPAYRERLKQSYRILQNEWLKSE